jgi:hypothetical protein
MIIPILTLAMMSSATQIERIVTYGPSAGELVEQCRNVAKVQQNEGGDPEQATECLHYIMGVVDAQAVAPDETRPTFRYCLMPSINTGQMARVIVKYGDDHPEILHQLGPYIISKALSKAFPCR